MPIPSALPLNTDNPAGQLVTFATSRVQPPASQYVTADDILVLDWINVAGPSSLSFTLVIRFLTPGGLLIPQRFDVNTATTPGGLILPNPGEGFILSAVLSTNVTFPTQAYVRFYLQRGAVGGGGAIAQVFLQGYPTTENILSFPTGVLESTQSGRGLVQTTLIGNPPAGADFSFTSPATQVAVVKSILAVLTTSSAVGNRNVSLQIRDSANNQFAHQFDVPVPASTTVILQAGDGMPQTTSLQPVMNLPLIHDLIVYGPGYIIKSITAGIQAGDQYTFPQFTTEAWLRA